MVNAPITFENLGSVTPDEISKLKAMHIFDHVNYHMIFDIKTDIKLNRR